MLDLITAPDFWKLPNRSHSQVGSLEVVASTLLPGGYHESPQLVRVVWELYGTLTTCKLPSCTGLQQKVWVVGKKYHEDSRRIPSFCPMLWPRG